MAIILLWLQNLKINKNDNENRIIVNKDISSDKEVKYGKCSNYIERRV